jgi:hypothetical protein
VSGRVGKHFSPRKRDLRAIFLKKRPLGKDPKKHLLKAGASSLLTLHLFGL